MKENPLRASYSKKASALKSLFREGSRRGPCFQKSAVSEIIRCSTHSSFAIDWLTSARSAWCLIATASPPAKRVTSERLGCRARGFESKTLSSSHGLIISFMNRDVAIAENRTQPSFASPIGATSLVMPASTSATWRTFTDEPSRFSRPAMFKRQPISPASKVPAPVA